MKTLFFSRPNSATADHSDRSPFISQTGGNQLRQSLLGATAISLLLLALGSPARASDPIGIYAVVDKVVLEPSATAPERVQIWGSFSFAEGSGYAYKAPAAGYLYYKLPEKKSEPARNEWADFKSMAGTKGVVGFGSRYGDKGRIRKPGEKPADPDPYPIAFGLTKTRKSDYQPVRDLIEFHHRQKAKLGATELEKK